MIGSFPLRLILLCFFIALTGLDARSSAYQRAQDLAEEDPIEAEALFVHFIAESGNDKLKRAAAHELFTLRLKTGRFAEAFFQARSETFRRRFLSALEEGLRLSDKGTRRLVAALRGECRSDGDVQKIADMLEEHEYPVAAYHFSIQVMTRCKAAEAWDVFPELPEAGEEWNKRVLNLALLESREAISRDDFEEAENLLAAIRKAGADVLVKEPGLLLQLDFTEARLMAKKEDFGALKTRCTQIEKKMPARSMRTACRFLTAYALMLEEQYADAYARIATVKIEATEIDNRLLRLVAAVAAGEAVPEKLKKFTLRRSYRECAPVLRKLAETILASGAQNN